MIIHLNGTDKDSLVNELITAHSALNDAIEAARQITVHMRDYYPQDTIDNPTRGSDAYRADLKDKVDFIEHLNAAKVYLRCRVDKINKSQLK